LVDAYHRPEFLEVHAVGLHRSPDQLAGHHNQLSAFGRPGGTDVLLRRDRRAHEAVAATRQRLDPALSAERAAQCGDLNRQVTLLDGNIRPGCLDQRILGDHGAGPLGERT
jgi:hypothetical protein